MVTRAHRTVAVKHHHFAFSPAVDFSISRKSLFIFLAQALGPFFNEGKKKLVVIYVRNYVSHKEAIRNQHESVLSLVLHVVQCPFLVTSPMKLFAEVPEIQCVSVWHKCVPLTVQFQAILVH